MAGPLKKVQSGNKLEIPAIYLVANKIFSGVNEDSLREGLEKAFGYDVIGMIPLCEQLAKIGSRELFVMKYPEHEVTYEIRQITERLINT